MTSLDASGFSITLLRLENAALGPLDATTTAVGWGQAFSNFVEFGGSRVEESRETEANGVEPSGGPTGKTYSLLYPSQQLMGCS
jgi:hypothetical protein